MMNLRALFKRTPKNKKEKDEKDQMEAKPVVKRERPVSSSSDSQASSVAPPPATPVNYPVPANKYMENAKHTDMESAVFGVVHGHDFNDPSMAATLSAANIPVTPLAQQRPTEILTGASYTNARYANFTIVGGNRYGAPQTHVRTNSATRSAEHEAELEPSLLR